MEDDDLSSFKSQWVKPISTTYKGYDVFQMPPQTQGFATLEMLNILQQCGPRLGYNLHALGPRSPEFWSILVQAKRLAYTDLERYNGDPRFVKIPLDRLISKRYAASLCSQISLGHVGAEPAASATPRLGQPRARRHRLPDDGRPLGQHGVVHLLDLRLLRSERLDPGLRVPDERPRVVLQSRPVLAGRDRTAQAAVPDHHPGVRHEGRQPLLSFGNMGGDEQAQAQATEIVNMVDLGMNVQAAGDAARFHHSQDADRVDLESHLYALVGPQLRALGLQGAARPGDDDVFGGYQAILFQRSRRNRPRNGRRPAIRR